MLKFYCNFATDFETNSKWKDMEDKLLIAKNIKQMRDVSGYTQAHVADFLSVGRSAYANYEAGEREMPFSLLEKLTNLYGCELYDLYSEDSNVVGAMLATAFRVDTLSPEDMAQIASFKRIVKNSLKMDNMLAR